MVVRNCSSSTFTSQKVVSFVSIRANLSSFSVCAGVVPNGRYDGAELRAYCWDFSVFLWLPPCQATVNKDRDDVQAVFGAALVPVPLWLWHEGCQSRTGGCWKSQTHVPSWEWGHIGMFVESKVWGRSSFHGFSFSFCPNIVLFSSCAP